MRDSWGLMLMPISKAVTAGIAPQEGLTQGAGTTSRNFQAQAAISASIPLAENSYLYPLKFGL